MNMNDLISRQAAKDDAHRQIWYRMNPSMKERIDAWFDSLPSVSLKWERLWIPFPKYTPDVDEDGCSELMLVSFENFSLLMIGQYRIANNGSAAWYVGDSDETFTQNGVFVNAFMPLPERYLEEEKHEHKDSGIKQPESR